MNAAMGSLHSFDRSLDKFMAWLSDTESSLESLELELDSYGPGVKTSRDNVLAQLKVRPSKIQKIDFSSFVNGKTLQCQLVAVESNLEVHR